MLRFSNSNVINVRKNRFSENGPTFKLENINSLNIGDGFESKNDKSDFFTNYLKSNRQKICDQMEQLYSCIINNDYSFIGKDYYCDEIYDNGLVFDRLISIINYKTNLNIKKKDMLHIYKLKNKNNKNIHIYISLVKTRAVLLLIDLYHLSIPADKWSNGRMVRRGSLRETKKSYEKFKIFNYNLNNIRDC